MQEREKTILDFMKNHGKPVRPGDISKATGINSKEVSAIIKKLKEEGKIYSPKRCYYAPQE